MLNRIDINQWRVFVITVASLVLKNILFQWFTFGDLNLDNITQLFKFYGGIIALSSFLSCPIFVLKKPQWYVLSILLLVDAWIIAVFINYRAWGVFLNMDTILMADNMKGFWGSIFIYFSWKVALFIIITCIASVGVFLLCHRVLFTQKKWIVAFSICLLSYSYVPLRQFATWKQGINDLKIYNPYSDPVRYHGYIIWHLFKPYRAVCDKAYVSFISGIIANWEDKYIKNQGIVDYGLAMIVFYQTYQKYCKSATDINIDTKLTDSEQAFLKESTCHQYFDVNESNQPERTLIIILVESFESWAIEYQNEKGEYAMPNIRKYIEDENTLYADKVTSQVKYGNSGDGQLLVLTGLLPISSGAACRLYGTNTYPNYAQYFPYSITINPSAGAWNQTEINPHYGITDLYENSNMTNDSLVLLETLKQLQQKEIPSMILAITISSHAPFAMAKNVDFSTDPNMPINMSNYIKCMNYFDSQFGWFVDSLNIQGKSDLDVVITGDHTIFKKMMLEELKEYAYKKNIPHLNTGENYCPLIIHSPSISRSMKYSQTCYQMDIYPTIIGVLEMNAGWNGFGLNLLSSDTIRKMDVPDCEILSDKLIRLNYFETMSSNN